MELKKAKTTVGRFKCPKCGSLTYVLVGYGANAKIFQCKVCKAMIPEEEWQTVEITVDGYVCPTCGEVVADSPENYSIGVWAGPEPVLVCPKDNTILRGYIHHEAPEGARIKIGYDELGGYIDVLHKDCPKSQNGLGYMELKRLCVDTESNSSRVVLVYVCEKCGAQQVIKASLDDTRIWNAHTRRWWRK